MPTALPTRLERLPPMRIARVRVMSRTPERDAWARLRAWAEPRGLLADLNAHPVFGFNNPPPRPQRSEYGYECWIRVDPETADDGAVELTDFEGGLYLVTTCHLKGDPTGDMSQLWIRLWQAVQAGPYRWRKTHELERPLDPRVEEKDMAFDLYLPVQPVGNGAANNGDHCHASPGS
jgi:DNA gyrase inhibitor GyrI